MSKENVGGGLECCQVIVYTQPMLTKIHDPKLNFSPATSRHVDRNAEIT